MSGAESPTTVGPMTRGRVRQDADATVLHTHASLPEENAPIQNENTTAPPEAPGAVGAAVDPDYRTVPTHMAISPADAPPVHTTSEALQTGGSREASDGSQMHSASRHANPDASTVREPAAIRAGLVAAGMREGSERERALLNELVAEILNVPVPDPTTLLNTTGRGSGPSIVPPPSGEHLVHAPAHERDALHHSPLGQAGVDSDPPRSLRERWGLPQPSLLRPRSALLRAATPTLRRPSLQRPPPLAQPFGQRGFSAPLPLRSQYAPVYAEGQGTMPGASLAAHVPSSVGPPPIAPCGFCGSVWHLSSDCPTQPAQQAPALHPPVPQATAVDFGHTGFSMRARKPSSFSGKPDENVVHWVRAMEKHLRVASIRGTDEQLITYVSQYLEGAADNWDHRRTTDLRGAPQEGFRDWLSALECEFRPIESAILLRTKFKRITQSTKSLKDYVSDFRSKRDEASAAGATISDEAARDIFVEGITTDSIKQDLWSKLTVDAVDMTCTEVIDRAMRLDANIAMAQAAPAQNRSGGRASVAVAAQAGPTPRPPVACYGCGSTDHMARECPHRSSTGSWRAPQPPRTTQAPPPVVQAHSAAVQNHGGAGPARPLPPPASCIGQTPPYGRPWGRLSEARRDRIDAEGGCKACQQVYSVCGHIRRNCPYVEPARDWQTGNDNAR